MGFQRAQTVFCDAPGCEASLVMLPPYRGEANQELRMIKAGWSIVRTVEGTTHRCDEHT